MRQQLLDLNEIQKIDLEIREIEEGSKLFSDRLQKLESGVGVVRSEVQSLTEQREANAREIKTLEGTVQAEALKIRKWEARLNEIRNQREYLALSREVEGSKRANRDFEEKILELMTAREEIEKRLDGLQDQLAEEEVDCESERSRVEREMRDAEQRVTSQTERRNVLVPEIPKALLKKYDTIRRKRFGQGFVLVVGGCCQGCNIRLPPQLFNTLQRGDTIEQCPSCQRIIFWDQLLDDSEADATNGAEANP